MKSIEVPPQVFEFMADLARLETAAEKIAYIYEHISE